MNNRTRADKASDRRQVGYTGEELDVWEATFKAAQKLKKPPSLSDKQMSLLLSSGRINQPPVKDKKIKIKKSAGLLVGIMKKKIENELAEQMGLDKWKQADKGAKRQLIWLKFVKRYRMGPDSVEKFLEGQLEQKIK